MDYGYSQERINVSYSDMLKGCVKVVKDKKKTE